MRLVNKIYLASMACLILSACDASDSKEMQPPSEKIEAIKKEVQMKPVIEVTIKDFRLGMSISDIEAVIKTVGLKYDNYGVHLMNACSSNTASPMVKPMIEGGMSSIEPHFYDQACQLSQYDLIGSTSEVNIVLHDDKLIWAHFYTNGRYLVGSNQTLINALVNKYGEPEKYQYRDIFGMENGLKWEIGDAMIILKSSSLTLESKMGREEFVRRDKALKAEKGSVL